MNTFGLMGYHHYFANHAWVGWIIVVTLLLLAFEIWMLVDVITSKKVKTNQKIWWVVGMFLIHPFVAIIYYFVSRFGSSKR